MFLLLMIASSIGNWSSASSKPRPIMVFHDFIRSFVLALELFSDLGLILCWFSVLISYCCWFRQQGLGISWSCWRSWWWWWNRLRNRSLKSSSSTSPNSLRLSLCFSGFILLSFSNLHLLGSFLFSGSGCKFDHHGLQYAWNERLRSPQEDQGSP